MKLSDPATHITGVGTVMGQKLQKLGIFTVFDLLYHLPFRYEDRRLTSLATSVQIGETLSFIGTLDKIINVFTKNGKRLQTTQLTDSSGILPVIWFNQTYLARAIPPQSRVALYGKIDFFNRKPTLISPEYEILNTQYSTLNTNRLMPIYPETAGLTSKWLRSKIYNLLANLPDISPLHASALRNIHFPKTLEEIEPARKDLAFDELLVLQLSSLLRRQAWEKTVLSHPFTLDKTRVQQFISHLPFQLTSAQSKSISEILADLADIKPMNRLLQGDVGSGKTVVAAIAAYVAHLNNYQTIFLAPTQILATQHYQTLSVLFKPFHIEVGLVTSQSKFQISNFKFQIIVGTHALLSESVRLDNVGLVIIDEQHRFGVRQRTLASSKGVSPHILTMTATPIPRTIALTAYGDLDQSFLFELPKNRLLVKTWVVPEEKRAAAYTWLNSQLSTLNSQLFVVCPFIEESESQTTIKAAKTEFVKLQEIFSSFKLGLLHGKLKVKEKDQVLSDFRSKKIDILVSTPVVEVGIDIPSATIMVIEDAHRFGLAQLHQLRGRVGRSDVQSCCLLFTDHLTPRLKAMEKYATGLQLAEIDFRLRGPGDVFGTLQHGQPQFKIASYQDLDLISSAKSTAADLMPRLSQFPQLLDLVEKDKMALSYDTPT